MQVLQLSLRAALGLAMLVPWLWLISFTALTVGATLHLGRLPSYNNPDPKLIAHLGALHSATTMLLVAAALSPLAVSGCLAIRSFVSPDIRDARWNLLAYVLGCALAAIVIFGNVLGLSAWFFD